MADILSQSEIDELLFALTSGRDNPSAVEETTEQEDDEIRPYNFRSANKFSKEQIRMLHFIYENYANRLSTFLSGTLRAVCEVSVVSAEEQTFGEFNNSLPSPAFLTIFEMPPLAGSSILELSSAVSYEIISRLFGGKGQYGSEPGKQFTEIEIAILNRLVQQMLSVMDESWSRVADVRTILERIETGNQFAQIVASNEPTIIITMNVQIGDVSDIINLCIPHIAIQPIAKQLVTSAWYSDKSTAAEIDDFDIKSLNARFQSTMVTLRAKFDDTLATVHDIITLHEGDVIRVNHLLSKDINVMVEHIPKFTGKMGVLGKRLSIKITDIIEEVSEDG